MNAKKHRTDPEKLKITMERVESFFGELTLSKLEEMEFGISEKELTAALVQEGSGLLEIRDAMMRSGWVRSGDANDDEYCFYVPCPELMIQIFENDSIKKLV